MKNTTDYLDEIKKRNGISSDYKLAQHLNVAKQSISRYRNRKGNTDNYIALKIAEALNINPLEVIATESKKRAKSEEERKAWERILSTQNRPTSNAKSGGGGGVLLSQENAQSSPVDSETITEKS